jgi:hypothetical protein
MDAVPCDWDSGKLAPTLQLSELTGVAVRIPIFASLQTACDNVQNNRIRYEREMLRLGFDKKWDIDQRFRAPSIIHVKQDS